MGNKGQDIWVISMMKDRKGIHKRIVFQSLISTLFPLLGFSIGSLILKKPLITAIPYIVLWFWIEFFVRLKAVKKKDSKNKENHKLKR